MSEPVHASNASPAARQAPNAFKPTQLPKNTADEVRRALEALNREREKRPPPARVPTYASVT